MVNIFESLSKLSSLASAKAYVEIQPIVADLMHRAATLSAENQELSAKLANLERELAAYRDFGQEKAQFLESVEDTGVTTIRRKTSANEGEQGQRFCPNCFGNMKIRHLQPTRETDCVRHLRGWFRVYSCLDCGAKLTFSMTEPVQEFDPSSTVF